MLFSSNIYESNLCIDQLQLSNNQMPNNIIALHMLWIENYNQSIVKEAKL